MVKLFLDDIRKPLDDSWTVVRTVDEAKAVLQNGDVEHASFDHDLGACADCLNGRTPEQWLEASGYTEMPHCDHVGTGYSLICWMEAENIWPKNKPWVHSANPVGATRMRQVIDRAYPSAKES